MHRVTTPASSLKNKITFLQAMTSPATAGDILPTIYRDHNVDDSLWILDHLITKPLRIEVSKVE